MYKLTNFKLVIRERGFHILKEKAPETADTPSEIARSKRKLNKLVGTLSNGSRRERQQAAHTTALVAKEKPEALIPHVNALVDALHRPEAQTRWEALDALTEIVAVDSRVCDKAIPDAGEALLDEKSGPLRLAAMRFLCRLGATTLKRSEKTWDFIDEGIQCYHGDPEFQEMLVAVVDFSTGKLSKTVKQELADRMRFDAENNKSALGRRAAQILENVS